MARWHSCNILQTAPDANRLWQFDARSGALSRESSAAPGQPLPSAVVAKSWTSLWQPRLNVAWLPPENIFLRVIELPKSSFGETLAMVELQLEKLSPMPVTQIVWTLQILPQSPAENLQTIIVVIVERNVVEEFLGKLETQGFLADRLEAPMLDQLAATPATEDGAWIYPALLNGQNAALVAWWFGGALRNLSYLVLPADGDRAKSLQDQLAQLAWAGELEGWLTAQPKWHLVADGGLAGEWETFLREGLGEPVQVTKPLAAAGTGGAHGAARGGGGRAATRFCCPPNFRRVTGSSFLTGCGCTACSRRAFCMRSAWRFIFARPPCLVTRPKKVEQQVAALGGSYTNVLQLKARYEVLKERQDLKYAALDCWKLVADLLPAGISLQRFSFGDGHQLSLNGTVASDQITLITDFYDALRKAQMNGQPMFNAEGGDQVTYHQSGSQASWNFSLELRHTEADAP